MIKVAVYGLVRVLVDWLGVVPVWLGALVPPLRPLSSVGGGVYALFQPDPQRLLAVPSPRDGRGTVLRPRARPCRGRCAP